MGRSGGGGGGGGGGFSSGGGFSGGFSGGGGGGGRSGGSGGPSFGGFGGGPGGPGGAPRHHHDGGSSWIPFLVGMHVGRSSGGGPSGGGPQGGPGGPSGGNGGGRFNAVVIAVVAILVVLLVVGMPSCGSCSSSSSTTYSGSAITASTVEREALPSGAAQVDGYYTDADGDWIGSASTLESGLKTFYKKTGVAPYVYILPNGQTTSTSELTTMAEELYAELFDDSAHFLLVFCDNGSGGYTCGYMVGTQAATVMDSEAVTILQQYLELYYNDYDISEEEVFSKTFESTAERIMSVYHSPVVLIVVCVAIVVVAGCAVIIVKKRNEQRERESKRTQDILSSPLPKFGDEAEQLAQKYEKDADGESDKGTS